MTPVRVVSGAAAVLEQANIDTDQILPARFLRKPRGGGYQQFLFHDVRHAAADFTLGPTGNPPIVLAGANFACGSSREGAVYALADAGVRCVIAESFGDIFAGNAAKNGLLTVVLPADQVATLMRLVGEGAEITIDLPAQQVRAANQVFRFQIDPFRKQCLVEGLDDIGLTLANEAMITAFEAGDSAARPWARPVV
jgi:3-isopropylmalate/(R)-2-methylmalate dehydratase small subunit